MTITPFPNNTRDIIEEIIHEIGRDVEFFYVFSSMGCPICTLDPVTNTSTNWNCPTCSGDYWIDTFSGVTMSAHITWKFNYLNEWETGGIDIVGDARVKVMYSPEREDIVNRTEYLVVDNKIMNVEKITLLGAPAINRIVVDVKEKEE